MDKDKLLKFSASLRRQLRELSERIAKLDSKRTKLANLEIELNDMLECIERAAVTKIKKEEKKASS